MTEVSEIKTPLKETIEHFHDYILDKSRFITEEIVGPNVDFKNTRLNVYHDGYALRLLEILGKNYIVLQQLLGDEAFGKLSRDYLRSYPSNHFSVRYFGRHFAKFLACCDSVEPLHVEIANFEWALEDIIDAKDGAHLTFEDLATLSPEAWGNLVLSPHPSFTLQSFFYPTPSLWQAIRHDTERPEIIRQEKPVAWLMWRYNHQARFLAADDRQLAMIRAIAQGDNFSQVCEKLCELMSEDEVINFAAQTLRQWISEGVFSEFRV